MATVNLVHNAPEAGWAEGSRSHLVASSRATVGVRGRGGISSSSRLCLRMSLSINVNSDVTDLFSHTESVTGNVHVVFV